MNNKINIWIGSDHGGFELKCGLMEYLSSDERYNVFDVGSHSRESVDYPEYALLVADGVLKDIESGVESFGILICGTGVGMSIVANKQCGIRAVLAHNEYVSEMGRKHNNANVLCIGARVIGASLGLEIVKSFLGVEFEGGRHERRVRKIFNSCVKCIT
tara:strand:- start:5 stop:481 length:477 start_codon:yes stop_codon:yes gene_type:complete